MIAEIFHIAIRIKRLCYVHASTCRIWVISIPRFSLHAEVRCAMRQRDKLEQLCRYITGPAIANERLKLNAYMDNRYK